MVRLCRRRTSLVILLLLGLVHVGPHPGAARAQTVAGEVAVDRQVALALKAMALWDAAPGVFVDLGYDRDDGLFVWTGQVDDAHGLFRLGHTLHVPGYGALEDSTAYRRLASQYRRAFPNLRVTVDDVIADGNKVVMRWTMAGTHAGDFGELAATGNTFSITGVTIFRTANGQIAETWFMPDALGLVTQLAGGPTA